MEVLLILAVIIVAIYFAFRPKKEEEIKSDEKLTWKML